jgi:hypothetical protein
MSTQPPPEMPEQQPMPEMPVPLRAQIAELEKEQAFRAKVYPRLIQRGTMTAHLAEQRCAALQAAIDTLRRLERERRA